MKDADMEDLQLEIEEQLIVRLEEAVSNIEKILIVSVKAPSQALY